MSGGRSTSPRRDVTAARSTRATADLVVRPIRNQDLSGVARFLASNMPSATPVHEWAGAWLAANNLPGSGAPNHGMLLLVGDEIVGEYAAIYSTRNIAGRTERFCNLAIWCVHPEFRSSSWRLARALLSQEGYHFTDFAPNKDVQKLNLRMGFSYFSTETQFAMNLPWLRSSGVRLSSDPRVIENRLRGDDLRVYRDHRLGRWARHIVIHKGARSCYVQWRVRRIRGRNFVAEVQYVSDGDLFRNAFRYVSSHLLIRHGMFFTAVEERVAGGRVPCVWSKQKEPRKMYKSDTLNAEHIDYLYSEITSQP